MLVRLASCHGERLLGHRLVLPCIQDLPHLADENLSRGGESACRPERARNPCRGRPPPGELGLGALPDLGVVGDQPLPSPEPAYSEEGIRPLDQTTDRPRVGAPWRVVAAAIIWQRQGHEI